MHKTRGSAASSGRIVRAGGVSHGAFMRRRMGSGGLRGLQNRCFGAEASKGWFDSDAPPPAGTARWRARPAALVGKAFFGSWDEGDYFAGGSVKNPIFIAPPSCAASIATNALSK